MPAKKGGRGSAAKSKRATRVEPDPVVEERYDEPHPGTRHGGQRQPKARNAATPAIVIKAAAILEDELASGLGAARRIERRFIDVEQLRTQPPDALISKFRRDAHDAVDILVDVIAVTTTSVTERAGRIVALTVGRRAAAARKAPASIDGAVQIPTVRIPGFVSAGDTAEIIISLENDSGRAITGMALYSSELVSSAGDRIAAARVRFDPPTLSVAARSTGEVTVRVDVPRDTPPGSYEGLLRAGHLESMRAMLRVQVR
jgi:hypothetical protein